MFTHSKVTLITVMHLVLLHSVSELKYKLMTTIVCVIYLKLMMLPHNLVMKFLNLDQKILLLQLILVKDLISGYLLTLKIVLIVEAHVVLD